MIESSTPESAAPPPKGIIHLLRLDGRGGASRISWEELLRSPATDITWAHLDFEDPEVRTWLENDSGLNDIASRALVNPETRPRALARGSNLLLTLRGLNAPQGEAAEDMVSLRIWTDGSRVISTRRRPLNSTQDVVEDLLAGDGPTGAAELLVAWCDRTMERMGETLGHLEDEVMDIEARLLADEREGLRLELAQLRKRVIAVRRYLSPQREAMNRLVGDTLPWLDELNRLRLREITDRLIRQIEDLDEVRDRAVLAQEELANRIAEEMNERSYVFTAVAGIFLPLGFLTGLLGINVGGMPGTEDGAAFWIVVLLCAIFGVALTFVFRVRRWL